MRVVRIDHVHLEVSDRDKAADWYETVLGLERHPDLAAWAEDPMGPLIMQGGDRFPTLSLFKREFKEVSRDSTVAFRIDGQSFIRFLDDVASLNLKANTGGTVTRNDVVDHDMSWSMYFLDPDLNRIEITTYDYETVKQALA
jgi:catechol 2,3-dioxygenase-like lactoylglutathione lyase family enzyme